MPCELGAQALVATVGDGRLQVVRSGSCPANSQWYAEWSWDWVDRHGVDANAGRLPSTGYYTCN
jgi:hypothetical protein